MATTPIKPVLAVIDAASKQPLHLVKADGVYKVSGELVTGDLYQSGDRHLSIVLVHKRIVIEDLDASISAVIS